MLLLMSVFENYPAPPLMVEGGVLGRLDLGTCLALDSALHGYSSMDSTFNNQCGFWMQYIVILSLTFYLINFCSY